MSYQQYANLTWREFIIKQHATHRAESKRFEHTRILAYYTVAVNRDPKKPFPTIQKFWPLPTDSENEPDEDQEYKRLRGILDNYKKTLKK